MAPPCNPLRTQCEEFVRAEIARVGVAGLDTAAVVRRFVELGATRSRVHSWLTDLKRQASAPDPVQLAKQAAAQADAAAAEALQLAALEAAREAAAVLDSLPAPAELAAVAKAAETLVSAGDTLVSAGPGEPLASVGTPVAAGVNLAPAEAQAVLGQIQTIMDTCNKVLLASLGPDGRIRNARQALNAVEALRRTLETALKLYESVSNVQQIETFMAEMLAEVRPLAPELAQAVIARMRRVQSRWSRVSALPAPANDARNDARAVPKAA